MSELKWVWLDNRHKSWEYFGKYTNGHFYYHISAYIRNKTKGAKYNGTCRSGYDVSIRSHGDKMFRRHMWAPTIAMAMNLCELLEDYYG